jgi:hypothetical protein
MTKTSLRPWALASVTKRKRAGSAECRVIPCKSRRASGVNWPRTSRLAVRLSSALRGGGPGGRFGRDAARGGLTRTGRACFDAGMFFSAPSSGMSAGSGMVSLRPGLGTVSAVTLRQSCASSRVKVLRLLEPYPVGGEKLVGFRATGPTSGFRPRRSARAPKTYRRPSSHLLGLLQHHLSPRNSRHVQSHEWPSQCPELPSICGSG